MEFPRKPVKPRKNRRAIFNDQGNRICHDCGTELGTRPQGSRYCPKCQSEFSALRGEFCRQVKKYYIEKAGGGCCKCGCTEPHHSLEFHHINDSKLSVIINETIYPGKDFEISGKELYAHTQDELDAEVEKCILVCVNCHKNNPDAIHKMKITHQVMLDLFVLKKHCEEFGCPKPEEVKLDRIHKIIMYLNNVTFFGKRLLGERYIRFI